MTVQCARAPVSESRPRSNKNTCMTMPVTASTSRASSLVVFDRRRERKKRADVAEHPKVFDHVGLLANGPPGIAELPFI